ncbi:MAG: hypothetical protein ABSA97_16135 [Verrucomicrobiia bacterium]
MAIQGIETLIERSKETSSILGLIGEFCRLVQLKDPNNGVSEAICKIEGLLPGVDSSITRGRLLIQLSILYESRGKTDDLNQAVRLLNDSKTTDVGHTMNQLIEERLYAIQAKLNDMSV